jgi:hypothetical protein
MLGWPSSQQGGYRLPKSLGAQLCSCEFYRVEDAARFCARVGGVAVEVIRRDQTESVEEQVSA